MPKDLYELLMVAISLIVIIFYISNRGIEINPEPEIELPYQLFTRSSHEANSEMQSCLRSAGVARIEYDLSTKIYHLSCEKNHE